MSLKSRIKIEENLTIEEDQCMLNSNGDPSQQDYFTVKIKEELEAIDEDYRLSNNQSENDDMDIEASREGEDEYESDSNIVDAEDIQIKTEITVEEAKVEQYSEFETGRLKFGCKRCSFRCTNQNALWNHNKVNHTEESNTRCIVCFEWFKGPAQLEKHIEDEHQGLGNKCKICSAHYKKGDWDEHKIQCPGRLLFNCNSCKKRYVTKEGLFKHLDEHGVPEKRKQSSVTELRVKEQLFTCVICKDDRAYRMRLLKKHAKDKHGGYYLNCPDCGKKFKTISTRRNHMKKSCKVGPARERYNKEKVKCPECPNFYKNNIALSTHISWIHRKKPVQCDECEMQFPNFGVLRFHKAKHHKEPSFDCLFCTEKFHYKHYLRRHMRLQHADILENDKLRKFKCPTCLEQFVHYSHFNKHLLQHEKDKRKDVIENHITSEEKKNQDNSLDSFKNKTKNGRQAKYECSKCCEQFSRLGAFNKHLKQHDNDKQNDLKSTKVEKVSAKNLLNKRKTPRSRKISSAVR